MHLDVFGDAWSRAWQQALTDSETYRKAAAKWEGPVVLEMAADEDLGIREPRAVYLDLWHGECREARPAASEDEERASYVIHGSAASWKRILDGAMEPMWALMSGKLELRRGRLARLVPYAKASRELLAAAQQVQTSFGVPAGGATNGDSEAQRNGANGHAAPAPEVGARVYRATRPEGLRFDSPPMRLWRKSKKVGIWDPEAIDFSRDAEDWKGLSDLEQEVILHLSSLFQAGEESVVLDLLPLMEVMAVEGRLEEEMYLSAFLWEEAKHVEVFRLFFDQVARDRSDLSRFHGPAYRRIFAEALPRALGRLRQDRSPGAQAEASVTYNMVVEGVLAETGYHAYHQILVEHGIMPGMQRAVEYLKADESRHMAYGVFLLSRLVAEHGEPVWERIEAAMGELLPQALASIDEVFDRYETMPFGLKLETFTDFATTQFRRRVDRVAKARNRTLDEVLRHPVESVEPQEASP